MEIIVLIQIKKELVGVSKKMTNLKGTEKLKMEQEIVEKELGTLYEFTLRLEEELNSIVVNN